MTDEESQEVQTPVIIQVSHKDVKYSMLTNSVLVSGVKHIYSIFV